MNFNLSSPAETHVSSAWVKYSRSGFAIKYIHPGDEVTSFFFLRVWGYIKEVEKQREGYIQYKYSSHTWNSKTKQNKKNIRKPQNTLFCDLIVQPLFLSCSSERYFPSLPHIAVCPLALFCLSHDCLDLGFPKAKKYWFVFILFLCPWKTTLETCLFRELCR